MSPGRIDADPRSAGGDPPFPSCAPAARGPTAVARTSVKARRLRPIPLVSPVTVPVTAPSPPPLPDGIDRTTLEAQVHLAARWVAPPVPPLGSGAAADHYVHGLRDRITHETHGKQQQLPPTAAPRA